MYILEDFQEEGVHKLLEYSFEALKSNQNQVPILIESPTGSGKTVMMASYIERLVDELSLRPGLNDNVAFIWFAPNTLHIQSYDSLTSLYSDTRKLNCINLDTLGNNPVLNRKDLLFVNWSSVDNSKKIWRKENETNTNLETLIENTKANSTEIILIIDEAHLSAFTGKQAIKVRHLIEAKLEVLVTATPIIRPQRSVFISRNEVVDAGIIKKGVRMNIDVNPAEQNGENVHLHLLRKAMAKKEELKGFYDKELGKNKVNPLLLIQLPSENASLSNEDKAIREVVEGLLNTEFNISSNNGRLAVWLSGEQDKEGLEEINGFQDVLIFKQAIAQGWNCPRAAVMVSYRNVQSPDFGIQTVGRILRMPHRRHYEHDDLNYGYVYTNIESNRINFIPADQDYFHKKIAKRRDTEGLIFDTINAQTIVNDRPTKGVLTSIFETKFFQVMEQRYGLKQLPDIDLFTSQEEEDLKINIEENKKVLVENGWEFNIDNHQITIPADLDIDPYEVNSIMLQKNNTQTFAITTAQFSTMFDKFCYDNITRLNRSKSWRQLRRTLINFAEYYLSIFEFEAREFFLFPQNRNLLIQHISQALESFEGWQKELGNKHKRSEDFPWEIPVIRYYNEYFNEEKANHHALEPFYEYEKASTPEQKFKSILEHKDSSLEWWYKNGDAGKDNFAVSYIDTEGVLRSFYVDFVIKFKSGKVGLFDTKTKKSDSNAPNKHNALLEYIQKENTEKIKFLGGVIIPEITNDQTQFRFCRNKIENTSDLTGWDYFNPEQY